MSAQFHEDFYPDAYLPWLESLVSDVRGLTGAIVEYGCWEGKSTLALARAAQPEPVIAVDHWQTPLHAARRGRNVFRQFQANVRSSGLGNVQVVRTSHREHLPQLPALKLFHYDGATDYATVFDVLRIARSRLVPGGIVCGTGYYANASQPVQGAIFRAVWDVFPQGLQVVDSFWYWLQRT